MEQRKYKTKQEVLIRGQEAVGKTLGEIDKTGRIATGKGAVGTVIEESWFGYKPNSKPAPDFEEAGVELKVTPYRQTPRGILAKERLVCDKLMNGAAADEQFLAQVSAVVILFCCGGTGWYGALNEGLTGDGSILITKSILDFVTACIFGSILGKIVPMLCIPQAIIYGALFLVSGAVQSFITPDIIADFSATGGIITLCAGLSLAGIKKDLKVLNLLPSLILIFLISSAWTARMG